MAGVGCGGAKEFEALNCQVGGTCLLRACFREEGTCLRGWGLRGRPIACMQVGRARRVVGALLPADLPPPLPRRRRQLIAASTDTEECHLAWIK